MKTKKSNNELKIPIEGISTWYVKSEDDRVDYS